MTLQIWAHFKENDVPIGGNIFNYE